MASFIKNMLGGGNDDTPANAFAERVESLEQTIGQQAEEIKALMRRIEKLEGEVRVLGQISKTAHAHGKSTPQQDKGAWRGHDTRQEADAWQEADATQASAPAQEHKAQPHAKPQPTVLFFSAPTPSGEFSMGTDTEQAGSSIYRLETTDGINGSFTMLNTHDAVATASISVSQFVKPACKVLSPLKGIPRSVRVVQEGTATCTAGVWKVTRKAQIEFEV